MFETTNDFIETFVSGKLVVHCPDKNDAIEFLRFLQQHRIKIFSDNDIKDDGYWEENTYDTCYRYNAEDRFVRFASFDFYRDEGYDIINVKNIKNLFSNTTKSLSINNLIEYKRVMSDNCKKMIQITEFNMVLTKKELEDAYYGKIYLKQNIKFYLLNDSIILHKYNDIYTISKGDVFEVNQFNHIIRLMKGCINTLNKLKADYYRKLQKLKSEWEVDD
jgi:hypothetical protein